MSSPFTPADGPIVQYVEPYRLFSSIRMEIGESKGGEDIMVSELVRKDQPLLEFPDHGLPTLSEEQKQPIALGANCYFSADHNQVFAGITGYPKVTLSPVTGKDIDILNISVEPLFRISADTMKAAIAIHPAISGTRSLKDFSLAELIAEAGITYGLDKAMVDKAAKCIRAQLPEFNIIVLATGTKPRDGKDAYLEFEVETGPVPGKILEDGTIDFRERMIFVPVTKGQIIARKVSATRGTAGKTVLGERVEPQPGRDIAVNTLKDASYSSKTKHVTATSDGVLSVVGDTIIKVCSRQEIMTDIDYHTGHIHSRNSVVIHGSVQPGFKVTTDGDLEIRGTVMSTTVSSRANIVIKSGILGKNSTISAQGDADLYFIEQGEIECGRNCIIRRESYYSTVIAGRNILCMPNSAVVGGRLVAAGSIVLGNVGSTNASPAFIAAGVDGRRLLQYNDLQKTMIEQQDTLIKCMQLHKGTARAGMIKNLEKEIETTRLQLQKLNLIPGTARLSRPDDDDEFSPSGGITIQDVKIEVHGIIHAGTVIQLGNRSMTLTNTISNRLFKLNDSFSDIAPLPLRRRRT